MRFMVLSLLCFCEFIYADGNYVQQQLMDIASHEAAIANIGANKAMMLYGVSNPMEIIERWNEVEQKPKLSSYQIEQIKSLELQKQNILKLEKN